MILIDVQRAGAVRIADLVDLLEVSGMTVRRDLVHLESRGWLDRVHGGAVLRPTDAGSLGIEEMSTVRMHANWVIARCAAQLIKPDSVIALSAGVTTWMLARRTGSAPKARAIVTNSSAVARALTSAGDTGGPDIILTGGVQMASTALVGPIAEQSISSMHVDFLFLGIERMNADSGFSAASQLEAQTHRALVASARQVIVLADSTSWGASGPAVLGPLAMADVLVTDSGIDDAARHVLCEQVGELVIAPLEPYTTPPTPQRPAQ